MQVFVGLLLLAGGLTAIVEALPLTHRLIRVMPQWAFTRGDVDRLASTTFLMAFVGILAAMAGAAIVALAVMTH